MRAHGDPCRGRSSVQIEINRALYMNEANCEPGPGFARLQTDLAGFARAEAEVIAANGP